MAAAGGQGMDEAPFVPELPFTHRDLDDLVPPGTWVGVDARLHRVAEAREAVKNARRHVAEAELELTRRVVTSWRAGASWRAIGAVLGISRQAASERFGPSVRVSLAEEP